MTKLFVLCEGTNQIQDHREVHLSRGDDP